MRQSRVTAAALFAACSTAFAVDQLPQAGSDLLQLYPGVRALHDQGRVRVFSGVPMTPGISAQDAATQWIQQHGEAFGVGAISVEPLWATPVMDGRYTAFGYRQIIAGLPVEYGNLRILVLNQPLPRVVYAAATLAATPPMARDAVDSAVALQLAQAQLSAKGLKSWNAPELLVWQGDGSPWMSPIRAWKVIGYTTNPSTARAYYINAATGKIEADLQAHNDTDVNGTVQINATPGSRADSALNPPVLMNAPEVKVTITSGGFAYTDRNGAYTIAHPGTNPVTVNTGVGVNQGFGGMWVNVVPADGITAPLTASTPNVTPPGPGNLLLNPNPAERLTAQANLLVCVDATHNYFKDRAPTFNALDTAIVANAGTSGTCNANFNPGNLTINFFNSGGGCNNTAFSSVISHEYGHFVVNRLGLAQNAFGEGYGDVMSMMVWDDNIIGRDFRQPPTSPTHVRDPIAANIQYPCSASCGGAVHCCGQLLGASWWRIRTNFGNQYGSAPGLDMTRTRQVAWALITVGGAGGSAMQGTNGVITANEILTVDDDDGNTGNGTPNRNLICSALAQGSVICPALTLIGFNYPNGQPAAVTPNQPIQINVNVIGVSGTPAPGTGTVSYRVGTTGSYTTIPMTQNNPNQYTAIIPAVGCAQVVQYYFTAGATGGGTQTDPPTAPGTIFSTTANLGATLTTVADLNFNADPGWTRIANGGALTTGQWDRGTPVAGSGGVTADFDGSGQCWVTDNRAGTQGAFDVDGGPNTLTTSAFNLSAYAGAQVSFARWYNSVNGSVDNLIFEYSTNNGANWTALASYPSSTGWALQTVTVPTVSAQTMFRWTANDLPNDSVTEAGIDAFKLVGISCGTTCYANCDGSTGTPLLTANDFTCFINAFANGDSYANCDASTGTPTLTANDFTCFVNSFAGGCP